jgi:hypothetical protein
MVANWWTGKACWPSVSVSVEIVDCAFTVILAPRTGRPFAVKHSADYRAATFRCCLAARRDDRQRCQQREQTTQGLCFSHFHYRCLSPSEVLPCYSATQKLVWLLGTPSIVTTNGT